MLYQLNEHGSKRRLREILGAESVWRVCLCLTLAVTLVRISPIGAHGSQDLWYAAQLSPLILASISVMISAKRVSIDVVGVFLASLVALGVLSSVWSYYPANTLAKAGLLAWVFAFLVITWAIRWIDRKTLIGDLSVIYAFILATLVAGAILWVVIRPAAMGYYGRVQGVYPNPNYTAITAALSVPLGIWLFSISSRRLVRVLLATGTAVAMTTIWVTGSRGALVAAIVGALVALAFTSRRRAVLALLTVVILGASVTIAIHPQFVFGTGGFFDRGDQGSDFTSGRMAIWLHLLAVWAGHPLVGIGYRTVENLPGSQDLNAHNIFLSVLVEFGLLGMVVWLGLLAGLFALAIRGSSRQDRMLLGAGVTALVIELTEASLFGLAGPTAILSWLVLLGMAAVGRVHSTDSTLLEVERTPGTKVEGSELPLRAVETVTVCMATFNGENFIEEQLRSVLTQLGPEDDVVIVDDGSTDSTVTRIHAVADARVRLVVSTENEGHVATFEKAIRLSTGSIILLSDQDDVWLPDRVKVMVAALTERNFVASNWSRLGGGSTADRRLIRIRDNETPVGNIGRLFLGSMPYFGCTMGFRREALASLLPFPKGVEAHDHWIGLVGNVSGAVEHLDHFTVARRIHEKNLTSNRRRLRLVLLTRARMTRLLLIALSRPRAPRTTRLVRLRRK